MKRVVLQSMAISCLVSTGELEVVQGGFRLDTRKIFLTMVMARHRDRLLLTC